MAADPKKPRASELINENLKRAYDELLKEDVPDRFRLLLARLKDKEQEK